MENWSTQDVSDDGRRGLLYVLAFDIARCDLQVPLDIFCQKFRTAGVVSLFEDALDDNTIVRDEGDVKQSRNFKCTFDRIVFDKFLW